MWAPLVLSLIGGAIGWYFDVQGPLGFHGFGLGATVGAALGGLFSGNS
jgi:hypothetical protein